MIRHKRGIVPTLSPLIVLLTLTISCLGSFVDSTHAQAKLNSSADLVCTSVRVIGVRGSDEPTTDPSQLDMGKLVYNTYSHFQKKLGVKVDGEGLDYPASIIHPFLPYSSNQGVQTLKGLIKKYQSECLVLIGYSQGGMVIHDALDQISASPNIKAVLVFGDPYFDPRSKQSILLGHRRNNNQGLIGDHGGIFARKDFPDWVYGIRDYCKVYDPLCDSDMEYLSPGAVECAPSLMADDPILDGLCHHYDYYDDTATQEEAANYLASLFSTPSPSNSPKLVTCSDHMTAPWVALYGGRNYGGKSLCFEGKGRINLRDYNFAGETQSVNIAANVTFYEGDGNHISYGYGYQTGNVGNWEFGSFSIES